MTIQFSGHFCNVVFQIFFSSLFASFCRPSLACEERACCVGWMAPEFLSCTESISHPGWWMMRTSSSGGWKCPHIGSQRGLKNKEQCLRDETLKAGNVWPNRASKIHSRASSVIQRDLGIFFTPCVKSSGLVCLQFHQGNGLSGTVILFYNNLMSGCFPTKHYTQKFGT